MTLPSLFQAVLKTTKMSLDMNFSSSERESFSDSDSDVEIIYSEFEGKWLSITQSKIESLSEKSEGKEEGEEEEFVGGNGTPIYTPKSPEFRPSTPQNILPLYPDFSEDYEENEGNEADTGNYHHSHTFLFFQNNIYLIH